MKQQQDIIIAGVGGQGILSIAAVIGLAALNRGLHIKQSEVHGMAQRGGAVVSHLRLANEPLDSDLIPPGGAGVVLSMEPMEAVRYLPLAAPEAWVVSSTNPLRNIANYPAEDIVLARLRTCPHHHLIPAETLARDAGLRRSANIIMLGAAAAHLLLDPDALRQGVADLFQRKGGEIVKQNLQAFEIGMNAKSI